MSDEFADRDRRHLLHPLHSAASSADPHVWVRGEGAYLIDSEGKRFLDGASGLWNVIAGHGRTELLEAARIQGEQLAFASSFSGNTNPRSIELAEKLAAICYPNINKFFFTAGGCEATESSI